MKIVIDIPEELYKTIKENRYIYEEDMEEVALSILSGTPLPDENEGTRYDCCYWNSDDKYCYLTGKDHCPSDCGDYD